MTKRISIEQRVVSFFRDAPLDVAKAIMGLCVYEIKMREPATIKSRAVRRKPVVADTKTAAV